MSDAVRPITSFGATVHHIHVVKAKCSRRGERGLVPRFTKLPCIPSDERWRAILEVAKREPLRNRLMLALAYDAGLRLKELCLLRTDVTLDVIESAHAAEPPRSVPRTAYFRIARVLHGMGILPRSISRRGNEYKPLADVDPEWAAYCARWRSLSTLAPTTAETVYCCILGTGRWLAQNHPDVRTPEGWTRDLAREYVAAVTHAVRGDLVAGGVGFVQDKGEPLSPSSKYQYLGALRIFLRDCQEWGLVRASLPSSARIGDATRGQSIDRPQIRA